MFVRWKTRRLGSGEQAHQAQLVEGQRETGRVRQRVLAYLGTYWDRDRADVLPLLARMGCTDPGGDAFA